MLRLGIDIGGTKVNIGLIDECNNIIFKQKELLPDNKDSSDILTWVVGMVNEMLAIHSVDHRKIGCCGIGVPGTVSSNGKIALKIPNLSWDNLPLAEQFESLTGIPTKLIQDSRAAAYGEYRLGNGQGRDTVVCITLGTGIGTGIVINGHIFNGALGGAGELGHIPAVHDGRDCGCGKQGCLECYAAGKGLDITAKELYGPDCSAEDIFNNAEQGDEKAQQILGEAVIMLGNAIVSMINLISPDCVLFSGGMCCQTKWLVEPLIAYINEHRYYAATQAEFFIEIAALGEDAPMLGAALAPEIGRSRNFQLSASIMCADMLHLERDLKLLEEAGIEYLHCDIMDGHFVPNLMLSFDLLQQVRNGTNLAFDIHLMTEKPENIIPLLPLIKGDIVSVHWESTPHVQRALAMIKEKGASAALAINPSTPIECTRDLLDDISMILIMTVNPGYAGQKLVPQSLQKITRMRNFLDDNGFQNISIEVDGNCSFENIPKMLNAGAEIFVTGSSSIFDKKIGIIEAANRLRKSTVASN